MRILLANMTAPPTIGGVENSLHYMARELRALGHDAAVFCLQRHPEEALRDSHDGIDIYRAPFTVSRWPHVRIRNTISATQAAVKDVVTECKPDAVWSRSAPVGLGIRKGGYGGPLLQIFSTNAKMNCRGLYLQTHGLPWMRRLMLLGLWPTEYFPSSRVERSLSRACELVAFSENMRGQLLASLPKGAKECHVIPPGVDLDVYSPESGARHFETIEREYGLDPGTPIVLYVGRLSTAKHIPMLMDAMKLLDTRAQLVLVGQGPDRDRLAAYGQQIGLTDRLIFAGVQRELLPGFYAMSRVTVLPTTTESFGQVYLESLASGTPAVGFAGDGCRVLTATSEIIRDGCTGAVVDSVGHRGLAMAIDRILKLETDAYAEMGRAAREDVSARYSWGQFVHRSLEVTSRLKRGAPESGLSL